LICKSLPCYPMECDCFVKQNNIGSMGVPASMAKDTSQVGLRLPNDVLKKLQKDPDGVSEAIRRRLDWTFELDKYDGASLGLMHAVLHLSRQVRLHTGIHWPDNEGVRRTLLAAIDAYTQSRMLRFAEGEDGFDAQDAWNERNDASNWLPFDDDPEKLGPRLARAYIQLSNETAEEEE
jgi:hypothetical protein